MLFLSTETKCPKCKTTDHLEVRDWSPVSRDGDVYCRKCDTYVRGLNT